MADWMPPLPLPAAYRWQSTVGGWAYGQRRDINPHAFADEYAIEKLYTADQTRARDAEVARAALEQAIQACEAEYSIEGVAQRCAAAIREKLRGIE